MKTNSTKTSDVQRRWFVVDGEGKILGRTATEIARVLRGKHKVEFTPHVDTGDFVVVVNAEKFQLTGGKEKKKMYRHHTGWIGHVISRTAADVRDREPERMIKQAVAGMLPKNTLGRHMLSKLKVYTGPEHPHAAQKPEPLPL